MGRKLAEALKDCPVLPKLHFLTAISVTSKKAKWRPMEDHVTGQQHSSTAQLSKQASQMLVLHKLKVQKRELGEQQLEQEMPKAQSR